MIRCLNSQSLGVLCQGIKRSKVLAYFCIGLTLERFTSDPSIGSDLRFNESFSWFIFDPSEDQKEFELVIVLTEKPDS